MSTQSQTEDEFKKILKRLFSEKKQKGELKEKFHAKVEQLQSLALEEEVAQVKTALVESEQKRELLQSQVEHSTAILQELQTKVTFLQEDNREKERVIQESRELHNKQNERWGQEKVLLEKRYEKTHKALAEIAEERELLQGSYEKLEKAFKQNQRVFREQSETHFSEMHAMQERVASLEYELQQTDLTKMRQECEQVLVEKEKNIALLQKGIREWMKRVEEGEAEVHKAQQHLAKKVKESALFQNVAQRQKEQLLEEQKRVAQERELRMQLEKSVEEYQQNEHKITSFTKQCNQESETMLRQLQEYSLKLQKEIEKQQVKMGELEKYREGYEKLLVIVNGLK